VRVDARKLGEKDADPDGAFRDFEAEKFFDGKTVAQVICQRPEVVDAVGEGHDLLVELGLAGLLNTGVKVADFGIQADNDFSVDLQYEPKHTVGRRVLGSHIEDHVLITGALSRRSLEDRSANVQHQR